MPINDTRCNKPFQPRFHILRRLSTPLRAVGVASAITAAGLALAENSPYYVGVSQAFGHESNLLRLNDGATAPSGYSKSDTVSSTSLLAGINQPFGRQRVRGDVALRANRYSNNEVFNNESYSANLALDWETINRLSGTLAGSANRSLSSFDRQDEAFLRDRNYEDAKLLDASVRLGLVTQYSLLASFNHRDVGNSLDQDSVQARNFRQNGGSLGVRWQPSSLITLGLGLRTAQGNYPKFLRQSDGSFLADDYKRNDIDLTADYRPTGQSTISTRISSGKTTYDRATQRNYDGVTGSLTWGWEVSGKLRLNTSLVRDTGQDSTITRTQNNSATADYSRVSTSLRVGADWAATSKIAVNAGVSASQRDLVGSVPVNGVIRNADGRERVTSFSVGARWAPTRSTLVGCNASTDRVSGSSSDNTVQALRNVKGNGINCYGQITLQ